MSRWGRTNLQEQYGTVRFKRWGKNHLLEPGRDDKSPVTMCGKRWLPGRELAPRPDRRTCVPCRDEHRRRRGAR